MTAPPSTGALEHLSRSSQSWSLENASELSRLLQHLEKDRAGISKMRNSLEAENQQHLESVAAMHAEARAGATGLRTEHAALVLRVADHEQELKPLVDELGAMSERGKQLELSRAYLAAVARVEALAERTAQGLMGADTEAALQKCAELVKHATALWTLLPSLEPALGESPKATPSQDDSDTAGSSTAEELPPPPRLTRLHAGERALAVAQQVVAALRAKCTAAVQESLKQIEWPVPLAKSKAAQAPERLAKVSKALRELVRLQESSKTLPESSKGSQGSQESSEKPGHGTMGRDAEGGEGMLWAISEIVSPVALRFRFHFCGKQQTNRVDKPGWALNWALSAVRDHTEFVVKFVQPALDAEGAMMHDALEVAPVPVAARPHCTTQRPHSPPSALDPAPTPGLHQQRPPRDPPEAPERPSSLLGAPGNPNPTAL